MLGLAQDVAMRWLSLVAAAALALTVQFQDVDDRAGQARAGVDPRHLRARGVCEGVLE